MALVFTSGFHFPRQTSAESHHLWDWECIRRARRDVMMTLRCKVLALWAPPVIPSLGKALRPVVWR